MSLDQGQTDASAFAVPPQRTPVEFDPESNGLRIGPYERRIADPSDPDQVFGAYLSLLYAVRGAQPGEQLRLRSADLEALLAIVGDDPETIEKKLIALMGCTASEARVLGNALLRHRRLTATLGIAGALAMGGAIAGDDVFGGSSSPDVPRAAVVQSVADGLRALDDAGYPYAAAPSAVSPAAVSMPADDWTGSKPVGGSPDVPAETAPGGAPTAAAPAAPAPAPAAEAPAAAPVVEAPIAEAPVVSVPVSSAPVVEVPAPVDAVVTTPTVGVPPGTPADPAAPAEVAVPAPGDVTTDAPAASGGDDGAGGGQVIADETDGGVDGPAAPGTGSAPGLDGETPPGADHVPDGVAPPGLGGELPGGAIAAPGTGAAPGLNGTTPAADGSAGNGNNMPGALDETIPASDVELPPAAANPTPPVDAVPPVVTPPVVTPPVVTAPGGGQGGKDRDDNGKHSRDGQHVEQGNDRSNSAGGVVP